MKAMRASCLIPLSTMLLILLMAAETSFCVAIFGSAKSAAAALLFDLLSSALTVMVSFGSSGKSSRAFF